MASIRARQGSGEVLDHRRGSFAPASPWEPSLALSINIPRWIRHCGVGCRLLRGSLDSFRVLQHRCIAWLITGALESVSARRVCERDEHLSSSQYLAASRYAVELIDVENLDLLYEAHTEGAIGVVFDDRLVDAQKIPNLPLITINSPLLKHGIHSVRADHYQQGLVATEHCIRRGHRAIGFLAVDMTRMGVPVSVSGATATRWRPPVMRSIRRGSNPV